MTPSVKHLRSSTADKRPTASGIANGRLAINTASTTPGLYFANSASGVVKVGPAHVGGTAPNATPAGSSGNSLGESWLDTSGGDYKIKIWDGSAWRSNVVTNDDISASAAIALSKLAAGMLPSGITVASSNLADGTIVDADINASASISLSKLATGALPTGITIASANITDGTITNSDISGSAAIADTKLGTISAAGKVSNSATTATSANTANAIVARDGSGNFSAGTITATLNGNAATATSATTAGRARPRRNDNVDIDFNYSGQGGQPTWLWGTNDGVNMLVWNPSNFSVNYANGAGYANVAGSANALASDVSGNIVRLQEIYINTTVQNPPGSNSNNGLYIGPGQLQVNRNNESALWVGRTTNGVLQAFFRAGNLEGSISNTSGTISYNPFLGSHWGRLPDNSKPDIPIGTILETVDQLIEWKIVTAETQDGLVRIPYNGPASVGDTVEFQYNDATFTSLVETEQNSEALNKHVCVKINDTPRSKGVFGVFLGWDTEHIESENKLEGWSDMLCAAVGNYFVRIAKGQALAIGDLIEGNGYGCGVVQSDDIIRASTVCKVTSTIPQRVYDDGSFLVTAVLCCG